jgi:GAF domain-containing protein
MNTTISIKQKLRLSFLAIIIIAALGSTYSFILIQKSKDYIQYKEQVSNILLHLKEARVAEKNFILYDRKSINFLEDGESEIVQKHAHSIAQINNQIDSVARQLNGNDMLLHTQLLALKSAIKVYNEKFIQLKDLYFKRGFKDHGLEGSMRDNVHALQECVSAEEQVFAFSLRRHEKDFMLRKDLKYLDRLHATAEDFQKFVAASQAPHMTGDYKSQTIRVIDKYVQKFSQLVSLEKEIGLTESDGVSGELQVSAESLIPISNELFQYVDQKSSELQSRASIFLIGSIMLTIVVGLIISIGLDKILTQPILLLNTVIQDEIEGKQRNGALDKIRNKDEIGKLTTNFKQMMTKLDINLKEITEKNEALQSSSEEDRARKWIAEGVSSFVDLMKNTNEGIEEVAYKVISGLVKYVDANQGGIFLVDDLIMPKKMDLVASYAYNRKKYLDKEVMKGEGLIGAVWEEREIAVIKDIPHDYISITSGLGHATPDKLIIVPIINEDFVLGVVEIASFKEFSDHEIELIQKTCNRFATTYESMKTQEKTNELLKTSQLQAEELKAQEEEMRQNLEELQATHEDYNRREKEMSETIQKMKKENQELRKIIELGKLSEMLKK